MLLLALTLLLLLLISIRIPIAVAMIATCLVYLLITGLNPAVLVQRTFAGVDDFLILALPGFILMGHLMNEGGVTTRLINLANSVVGRYRGGLAHVNVGSSVLMAAMSGSSVADAAAVGTILIPEMKKTGYKRGFAAALTGSTSLIAPMLPPSIPFIVYASMSGVSVGAMFVAGIIPGLLLGLAFMTLIFIMAKRAKWPAQKSAGLKEIALTLLKAVPALFLPFLIVGGILSGIFTPTEASIVACMAAVLLGLLVYRKVTWRGVKSAVSGTVETSATVLLIVGAASGLSWVFTVEGAAHLVADVILPFEEAPWLMLIILNIALLIAGTFMETLPLILLLTPILTPSIVAIGIDPVHFGVMLVLNVLLGSVTPPVGAVMMVVCKISGASAWEFFRSCMPFYLTTIIVLILITLFPPISLWLGTVLGV